MNEFTKDELIIIKKCLEYRGTAKLVKKTQSIIENYCEHECNGEIEIFVDTCSKCNAYLLRDEYLEQ